MSQILNTDQIKSKFFNFEKKISNNEINTSHYLGWNSLVITKYEILENKILDDKMIDIATISKITKNFVIVKGALEFKTDNKKMY